MSLRSSFLDHGKSKLGYPYPGSDADSRSIDYAPTPTFTDRLPNAEQRQYVIDTIKVTGTDLVGGAVHRIMGNR